jgi:hypothetical protein
MIKLAIFRLRNFSVLKNCCITEILEKVEVYENFISNKSIFSLQSNRHGEEEKVKSQYKHIFQNSSDASHENSISFFELNDSTCFLFQLDRHQYKISRIFLIKIIFKYKIFRLHHKLITLFFIMNEN